MHLYVTPGLELRAGASAATWEHVLHVEPGQTTAALHLHVPYREAGAPQITARVVASYATADGLATATADIVLSPGGTPPTPPDPILYQQGYDGEPPLVRNLRIDDIHLFWIQKLAWEPPDNTGDRFQYKVWCDGTLVTPEAITDTFLVHNQGWASGSDHYYQVRVVGNLGRSDLTSPPPGVPPSQIHGFNRCNAGDIGDFRARLDFTAYRYPSFVSQMVDSRVDPRWDEPPFLDFPFGARNYRGGLSVGNAHDGSRVARAYAKWHPTPLAQGRYVMAASANLFFTRLARPSTQVQIGAQRVPDDWTDTDVNWTSSCGYLVPANAASIETIAARPGYPLGQPGWRRWLLPGDMMRAWDGAGYLSVGFAAVNETADGWAYFTKRNFDDTKSPYLVWAVSDRANLFGISLNPRVTYGSVTVSGTVWLNGRAPAGGVHICLESSDALVAPVPAVVYIPENSLKATFQMLVSAPAQVTAVTVRGLYYRPDPSSQGSSLVRETTIEAHP